jgi:hypothetical protein
MGLGKTLMNFMAHTPMSSVLLLLLLLLLLMMLTCSLQGRHPC